MEPLLGDFFPMCPLFQSTNPSKDDPSVHAARSILCRLIMGLPAPDVCMLVRLCARVRIGADEWHPDDDELRVVQRTRKSLENILIDLASALVAAGRLS